MSHKTQISAIVVAMVVIVGLKLAYDRRARHAIDTPTVSSNAPGPLGAVIDAAMGTDGSTYLADGGRQTVRVLDHQFRALGEVGAPDSATGRYRDLQAVRAVGDGRFAALDRTLRRIDVYEWDDGVARGVGSIRLGFEAYDFCPRADGSFVVLGSYNGMRLHRVDATGTVTASAAPVDTALLHMVITREGAPFSARLGEMLNDFVIHGNIACLDDGVIVLTSRNVPIFEVFRGASIASMVRTRVDSIWPVSRSDIETRDLDDGRSSVSFEAGADGYHSPMRAIAVPGGFLVTAPLVTVPVRDRKAREQLDSVRVFEFALTAAGVQRRMSVAGEAVPVAPGTFLVALPEQAGAGQLRMLRYSEMRGQGLTATADSLQRGVVPGTR